MNFQVSDMAYMLPEVILTSGALVVLMVTLLWRNKSAVAFSSFVVIAAAGYAVGTVEEGEIFGGMFLSDGFASFFKFIFLLNAALAIMVSGGYLKSRQEEHGEYYGLILFSTLGMMVMASAGDLATLYLGLELMALSTYVLAGFTKGDTKANESSMKYFLLGAFSSAFLLYGISMVYGLTGTTNMAAVASAIKEGELSGNPVMLTALFMFVVAFGFKIAAVPFHMWAPDVYEGAPTPVTAFMSVGPKAAGFAIMARVFVVAMGPLQVNWSAVLVAIAILTMAVGNIVAISQTNIKRMLAYSSIAHAGYALLGLIAGTPEGVSGLMNYMMIYAFMNVGAFSVVILLDRNGVAADNLDDYRGLAKSRPLQAFMMLIFMFSLTGIPPTAGFVGKFYLFKSALEAGYTWVVIAAALFSSVSAYFYLRVVRLMYMEPSTDGEAAEMSAPLSVRLVVAVTLVAVLAVGMFPDALLSMARSSVSMF